MFGRPFVELNFHGAGTFKYLKHEELEIWVEKTQRKQKLNLKSRIGLMNCNVKILINFQYISQSRPMMTFRPLMADRFQDLTNFPSFIIIGGTMTATDLKVNATFTSDLIFHFLSPGLLQIHSTGNIFRWNFMLYFSRKNIRT